MKPLAYPYNIALSPAEVRRLLHIRGCPRPREEPTDNALENAFGLIGPASDGKMACTLDGLAWLAAADY